MSEPFQLVLRDCKCGCGKQWRCHPDSSVHYYSNMHAWHHNANRSRCWNRDESRGPRQAIEAFAFARVTQLVEMGMQVHGIKHRLNDEGYRTLTGKLFTASR